jgi:hypothetical protein
MDVMERRIDGYDGPVGAVPVDCEGKDLHAKWIKKFGPVSNYSPLI